MIFLEEFSGHFFATKLRRKNPVKEASSSITKICEKSVLQTAGPNL